MASSTGSTNEERAHTAGVEPPAAGTLLSGEEAGLGGEGAGPGMGAEESYLANGTRGGAREETSGRLSPACAAAASRE